MNLEKANYEAICLIGNLDDFKKKLEMNGDTIDQIKNQIDEYGTSLLECALSSGRFDIAGYLLDNHVELDVIHDEGNEFHDIAYRLNNPGGVEMAYRLLDIGVSLNIQDKKYKNTGFFTLCHSIFIKKRENEIDFLVECLKRGKVDIDIKNIRGISARDFIHNAGPEVLKDYVEKM